MEPPEGEVFLMPHENRNSSMELLFLRHRILTKPSCGFFSFLFPASRNSGKGKSMYFDAKEFGKRLQDVRKIRGLTQLELSERLGLASKQHISRIERGEKTCSIDLLIELSCILHVSTDYLLMGKEPAREHLKNDLLSVISQLTTITKEI